MFIKDLVQHWLMTNRRWSRSPVLNVGDVSVCCLRSVQICIWWRSQNCRGPFFYYICHFWHWESAGAFLLSSTCSPTCRWQILLDVSTQERHKKFSTSRILKTEVHNIKKEWKSVSSSSSSRTLQLLQNHIDLLSYTPVGLQACWVDEEV